MTSCRWFYVSWFSEISACDHWILMKMRVQEDIVQIIGLVWSTVVVTRHYILHSIAEEMFSGHFIKAAWCVRQIIALPRPGASNLVWKWCWVQGLSWTERHFSLNRVTMGEKKSIPILDTSVRRVFFSKLNIRGNSPHWSIFKGNRLAFLS